MSAVEGKIQGLKGMERERMQLLGNIKKKKKYREQKNEVQDRKESREWFGE